ncbi:MAG: LolA-related protein [Candidatus Competibacterales bacterium]
MRGRCRRGLALMALVSAAGLPPSAGADPTAGQLLAPLAEVAALEAQFRETKFLRLLTEPLELRGTLHYRAPDYLEKRVTDPYPSTSVVEGEWLTTTQPGEGPRHWSLEGYPALGALAESLRAIVGGDVARLERHYHLAARGDLGAWTVTLTPRVEALTNLLATITVAGGEGRIHRVTVVEADGDRSVTTIVATAVERR